MIKGKKIKGFTFLEVIVSLTFFTIVSSSIYLMSSYLISSTEFIANNYLSKLSYRSYLERIKVNEKIDNQSNIKINSINGELSFSIEKSETPNNKIILLTLTPTYPKDEPIQSYWRVKWASRILEVSHLLNWLLP